MSQTYSLKGKHAPNKCYLANISCIVYMYNYVFIYELTILKQYLSESLHIFLKERKISFKN